MIDQRLMVEGVLRSHYSISNMPELKTNLPSVNTTPITPVPGLNFTIIKCIPAKF